MRSELTFDDLLALPRVERQHTLECISNEVGGPLIGNAFWRGAPVRRLLERAGVVEGAIKVSFRSVDGYSSAIPLDLALDERTLIAYGMNGVVLRREHGFPARLLIPGRYGMKNVKWLGGIEVTTTDHLGFWERRAGPTRRACRRRRASTAGVPTTSSVRGCPWSSRGSPTPGPAGSCGWRSRPTTGGPGSPRSWEGASRPSRGAGGPRSGRRPLGAGTASRCVPGTRGSADPGRAKPLPFGATGIHSYQVEAR